MNSLLEQLSAVEEESLRVAASLAQRGVSFISPAQHPQNLGPKLQALEREELVAALEHLVGIGVLKRAKGDIYPLTHWEILPRAIHVLRRFEAARTASYALEEAQRNKPTDYLERWTRTARTHRFTAAAILFVLAAGPVVGLIGGVLAIWQVLVSK